MTLLWKYNPFMFSNSDHAPVLYKGIALPIKQSFLCLCCPAFSWIFTNINASVVIINRQVCVPEVHLYQMNLAVSRARCNDPCYYSFICPRQESGSATSILGSSSAEAVTARASPAEQGASLTPFFSRPRLTLPFPSPGIMNRARAYCKARLK